MVDSGLWGSLPEVENYFHDIDIDIDDIDIDVETSLTSTIPHVLPVTSALLDNWVP